MLFAYDRNILNDNQFYRTIAGVDEAGRGPLAGPVCASAVILDMSLKKEIAGINDSKKLTENKREKLFEIITNEAISYAVAWVTPEEIDEINILQASLMAMRRAVEQLSVKPDLVLVDGNADPKFDIDRQLVIKGDATSASIAAASILAKVSRDRHLKELAQKYPQYQFEKHKGYPTKLHYEMLDKFGPSPIHRKTFLRKWEASKK